MIYIYSYQLGRGIRDYQDERYYILQAHVRLQTSLDSLNTNVSDNYNKKRSMNELLKLKPQSKT
ncbi:hypothetical protein COL39_26215 [Bacillus cereus]|nr:hypothetical protein COL39_26215 [Bacillus cereus]